jgi:adenylate cyclase
MGIDAGELVFQGWRASGDALNIAARLERICQPGEICISAALLDQAKQVRGISLESMGTHKLKNIRELLQVFRVMLAKPVEARALDFGISAQYGAKQIFEGQASIAVLPLAYVDGGAADAYFAGDIAEGMVSLLADLKELVVISQSRAAYGGRYLDAHEFGPAHGVRYVLSGSVRRSTTTVCVTAKLCDAANGVTLWADTTEVLLGERFVCQHRIAERIVAAVVLHIRDAERCGALRGRLGEPAACDLTVPALSYRLERSGRLEVVGR